MDFAIREAVEADAPLVLDLVRGLADYERKLHEVSATEEGIRAGLFGPTRYAEVAIAEAGDGEALGFALFFPIFSTFAGRPGIYLEDLFVRPRHRGRGVGSALLGHLARLARERGCGRLQWSVLDWNEPAVEFYRRLGARPVTGWNVYRLEGEALERLATG